MLINFDQILEKHCKNLNSIDKIFDQFKQNFGESFEQK